ncbi:peptidoglycan -binding protein [Lamprobacter modestohalophilus]|uniref:peptidoglycan -binding protein n=1 Tax=Lamprobacter modestohalophilus TaxID=1064514 RepID=UPI002ADECF15|nr:peptidoglycan -binding protein [Lamprobacter modestohalophilus]MEA1048799.1 peptidoglycan -binding protein [Lamprobacter modestohalophilus]
MFTGIRRSSRTVNVWPGYVDALSALLMVVIFVLLIFTLAQFLLRQVVSDQEFALDLLSNRLAEVSEALGLSEERAEALNAQVALFSEQLAEVTDERDSLAAARDQDQLRLLALDALVASQQEALAQEQELTAEQRDQVALLNLQIAALRTQLQEVAGALAAAERDKAEQAEEITDLGERLNLALARQVNELERYRSEFFGRVKEALGENPDVRITGDRFVFQSELLFPSGEAALNPAGRAQLEQLAETLLEVAKLIPDEIDWVLRIDGHTDPQPLREGHRYASNWELSTARALSVVEFLASRGLPPERMVAAGFGEHRPAVTGNDATAYRRNRRIEIKLTSP